MESVVTVDISTVYGQCRCCSANGNHRDLFKEYCWQGIREVYSDIFVECFNYCLSTKSNLTSLICEKCVKHLRDASSFKILAVNTETQLLESLALLDDDKIIIKPGAHKSNQSCVKEEEQLKHLKVESWPFDQDGKKYSEDIEDDFLEDDISPLGSCNSLVEGELELLSRFSTRQLRPLPSRDDLNQLCVEYTQHLKSLEGKQVFGKTLKSLLRNDSDIDTAKAKSKRSKNDKAIQTPANRKSNRKKYAQKEVNIDTESNPHTVERLAHATNISALLEFSNVIAFKAKHQRAYPCFYCDKRFEEFQDLRLHQNSDHTKEDMGRRVLEKYKRGKPDGLVVYVDVTDLKCGICDVPIANLRDLKAHLTGMHGKRMFLELSDRVIPFKVLENNFECQVCGNLYETFGSVERHMNRHYRNYVCDECDAGFVTKQRLRIHGYLMHPSVTRRFACEVCHKEFASHQKRRTHTDTVHGKVKKYKCNRCPEKFNEYFRRHKHMVTVHGVAPIEYKCGVCDKSFDRRYSLSTHMRTHIQQKDVRCDLCPYRCFTKVELRNHMVKHTGERVFECAVCKKSYARGKTLREHMKIHTNDRRYVCPVCGMSFIQNCSLKSHVKAHHKEYGLL